MLIKLRAIHFYESISKPVTELQPSGDKHEKRSPEDADMKPPRSLLVILGGLLFCRTIRLSQGGPRAKSSGFIDHCLLSPLFLHNWWHETDSGCHGDVLHVSRMFFLSLLRGDCHGDPPVKLCRSESRQNKRSVRSLTFLDILGNCSLSLKGGEPWNRS